MYVLQVSNSTADCKAKLFHLSKEVISTNSKLTKGEGVKELGFNLYPG